MRHRHFHFHQERALAPAGLGRLLRDERGMELVEWLATTGLVIALMMAVWTVFYGGPGRQLRAAVQAQVNAYAHGFDGGLATNGPAGRVPVVEGLVVTFDPTPYLESPYLADDARATMFRPDPFDPNDAAPRRFEHDPFMPAAVAPVPAQPGAVQAAPFQPGVFTRTAFGQTYSIRTVVQPLPGVQVGYAPERHEVILTSPVRRQQVLLNVNDGTAVLFSPDHTTPAPITLQQAQQMQFLVVRYEVQPAQPVVFTPVLSVPSLFVP